MKKLLLLFIVMLQPIMVCADIVEIDGIWYNIVNVAEVISNPNNKYKGILEIPDKVTHEGKVYTVTKIGDGAFCDCSDLTSVTIPNSVTSIGESAFQYCSSLISVIIPNGVTSISESTFFYCSGLKSVSIPSSVTSIGVSAFNHCSGLASVISMIENPFDLSDNVFNGVPRNTKLIVPIGTKTMYIAKEGWKLFDNITDIIDGDVNLDDRVNQADVDALVDYIMGNAPKGLNEFMSDVNRDGKVNVADVTVQTTLINNHTDQSIKKFTVNGVSFKMIRVDGGSFGQVTLSTYYMGETEVTQELWEAVMGSKPWNYSGGQNPVYGWRGDCYYFIRRLNSLTGMNFRLPKIVEWKYAAHGGNKSQGYKYAGSNVLDEIAYYKENSDNTMHNVKQKTPNELGRYDMNGNVEEWVVDMEHNGQCYYLESASFEEDAYYYTYGGDYLSPADSFSGYDVSGIHCYFAMGGGFRLAL